MRLRAFTYLGIAATAALLATTVYQDEEMRAHATDFTARIAQVQRDTTQGLVPTNELPGVLTGRAEVIDGRTLRYMVSGLTVELAGIDVCAAGQSATFEGTPWPCGVMATAWLVSQTLGRDLQCQRLDRCSNGTIVARCAIDGADLAGEALLSGHAVVNAATRAGVPIAIYRELEERAHVARTGLWNSEFARPEDFRREGKRSSGQTGRSVLRPFAGGDRGAYPARNRCVPCARLDREVQESVAFHGKGIHGRTSHLS